MKPSIWLSDIVSKVRLFLVGLLLTWSAKRCQSSSRFLDPFFLFAPSPIPALKGDTITAIYTKWIASPNNVCTLSPNYSVGTFRIGNRNVIFVRDATTSGTSFQNFQENHQQILGCLTTPCAHGSAIHSKEPSPGPKREPQKFIVCSKPSSDSPWASACKTSLNTHKSIHWKILDRNKFHLYSSKVSRLAGKFWSYSNASHNLSLFYKSNRGTIPAQ